MIYYGKRNYIIVVAAGFISLCLIYQSIKYWPDPFVLLESGVIVALCIYLVYYGSIRECIELNSEYISVKIKAYGVMIYKKWQRADLILLTYDGVNLNVKTIDGKMYKIKILIKIDDSAQMLLNIKNG